MQITIINVVVQKVKTYQVAEITYTDYRGETKNWKLMSFSNPATFAVLKDAKQGEIYEISLGKNDKDYTVWTQAVKASATASGPANVATPAKAAWVPDADRQRLIVKQSSLTAALKYYEVQDSTPDTLEDVLHLADKLVAYVYDVPPVEVNQE